MRHPATFRLTAKLAFAAQAPGRNAPTEAGAFHSSRDTVPEVALGHVPLGHGIAHTF